MSQSVSFGACDPKTLSIARLGLHHLLQPLAQVARALVPTREDESHTAFHFDDGQLVSEALPNGHRVALDLARAEPCWLGDQPERFSAEEKSPKELQEWLIEQATRYQVAAEIDFKLPYEIPAFPFHEGMVFQVDEFETEYQELAAYFQAAHESLVEVAGDLKIEAPIQIWPHHFDIAFLHVLNREPFVSVGLGMSPGDENISQPYFYAAPWPKPPTDTLPKWPGSSGYWFTEPFVSGVIPADRLILEAGDEAIGSATLTPELKSAYAAARRSLGSSAP